MSGNAVEAITVAASTIPRKLVGHLLLGDGTRLGGASIQTAEVGPKPLVYSNDSALAGIDPQWARLCFANTLDPAMVAGKIVAVSTAALTRLTK